MSNESKLLKEALAPNSDQLNADDLIGGAIDIVIRKVTVAASGQQRIAFYYHGDNDKPYKPCKSMGRLIMEIWGDEPAKYIGRGIRLYRDPEVKMKGVVVGGVRISHMTDINEERAIPITVKRGVKEPWTVKPLVMQKPQGQQDKSEAAKKKAAEIIAEINGGGDVDAILQREAAVIERFRNAYSGLYNDIINASTSVNFSDEEIPA